MKKKIYRILLLVPLLLSVLALTGCKVMMPSDYIKIKRIIIEDCNKVGLHGKVTITDLHWTPLESPTYYVSYTYSENTYDGQTIKLEENNRAIPENRSSDSYDSIQFLHYKESFLEQKSVQKVEKNIEKQLKKNSVFLLTFLVFYLTSVMMKRRKYWILLPPKILRKVRRTLLVIIKFHTKP